MVAATEVEKVAVATGGGEEAVMVVAGRRRWGGGGNGGEGGGDGGGGDGGGMVELAMSEFVRCSSPLPSALMARTRNVWLLFGSTPVSM